MSFYKRHVFVCTNKRDDGSPCCAALNARQARDYLKQRAKEADIHGPGNVRINITGCMGRCEEGPVIVVYPEGVWYTFVDKEDLDQIFDDHLQNGKPVERLQLVLK